MKKQIAWGMMSGGIGALGMFGAIVSQEGWPPPSDWLIYFWPGFAMAMGVAGVLWLRRLYKYEAPEPSAAWTLSLTDFIFGMLFAGLCGAAALKLDSDGRRAAPVFVFFAMTLYLQGSLAASLEGIFAMRRRVAFVLAHVLLTLGYMSWSTVALGVIVVTFLRGGGPDFEAAWFMLRFAVMATPNTDLARVFSGCVFALPVGMVLVGVMRRARAAVE